MDKASLRRLKEQLPKRYAKQIKEMTGKSYASIFKTFNENSNLVVVEVVDAALEIVETRKNEARKREERLAQL
ncbi:MAG: hypothetical protein FD166_1425 [Bacteroidetes bacterium]|nr:MAG: hypothetical protein FD166_1425 [Bacteroidota bacterium]